MIALRQKSSPTFFGLGGGKLSHWLWFPLGLDGMAKVRVESNV